MKTTLFKVSDRGFANYGWLQANYYFSFAQYYHPEKVQFGALRVLNDDLIAPSMGFSTHPHDNMEIITIPLSGKLKHRDNVMDDWQEVLPGEVQVMSAGTGIYHSEMNASAQEHLSLFQIWIFPDKRDVAPRYDQKTFDKEQRKNKLQLLVTAMDAEDKDSLKIHQNARISRIDMDAGTNFKYDVLSQEHGVFVLTVQGVLDIAEHKLGQRDALGVSKTNGFKIQAKEASQVLFIEVPMM